jgi:hypothetical protein
MKEANKFEMIEELRQMPPGSRLVRYRDASFLLLPGETIGDGNYQEWLVKRDGGIIADAATGEILAPRADE